MTFELPKLNFSYDALEPYFDATTMEIHHTKHHQGYTDKLNKALETSDKLKNLSIEAILSNLSEVPDDIRLSVRNNGGGYLNHKFFWETLTPDQNEPGMKLTQTLNSKYGSIDDFKQKFKEAALSRFGSGWAWLVETNGDLEVLSTPNQDNPYMQGQRPILGLDVWEHAYYLKYQNKRGDFVDAFWNVVDWGTVEYRLS